ncbi:MAG: hypothetical protein CFE43_17635 [Burkholderiales bacterium PBB3]|nr:MAG: hypothetical protein CFE43_17635 [Burkholderiales bacterium PBB3]
MGVADASDPGRTGSETLVYTRSPSLVFSAGFTMSITLGEGSAGVTETTGGLTGATGMTLPTAGEAKSAAGRKFGVRSTDGNCILFGLWAPPVTFFC